MASNSGRDSGAASERLWIGRETLDSVSLFSADGAARVPRCIIGRKEDWEILLPSSSDRVCSCFSSSCIPMYEAVFQEVGFRLPFSPFQVSVFDWLELCPSHLSLDSFSYLIAFEQLCQYLCLPTTKELFFVIFTIQLGLDKNGGHNWVSFRQRKALFEIFGSETTKFQKRFFLVRPRTEEAMKSVLKMVERPHEDVGVVLARVPRFHFCWSQDHFKHEPAMYRYGYADLTNRNKTSFARILEFVGSFSRSEVVDEDGNPVLDSRGNQVTKPHLIDTHSLVLSKDPINLLGRSNLSLFAFCLIYGFY